MNTKKQKKTFPCLIKVQPLDCGSAAVLAWHALRAHSHPQRRPRALVAAVQEQEQEQEQEEERERL